MAESAAQRLAEQVRTGIAHLPVSHLSQAGKALDEAAETLYPLAQESNAPELADAIEGWGQAREHIDCIWQVFNRVRATCEAYLANLGASPPQKTNVAARASQSAAEPRRPSHADRVDKARREIPRGVDGRAAEGRWINTHGEDVKLVSGERTPEGEPDPAFLAATRLAWELKLVPPIAPPRLAGHVEIKFAAGMKIGQKETIVMDRPPCGVDNDKPLQCHRQLPHFLPDGAELTVVDVDGATWTYRGRRTA